MQGMFKMKYQNPFHDLPKNRQEIVRKDFEKGKYDSNNLGDHLKHHTKMI